MQAPNFAGEYPGAGQMIGPAWRAAWKLLQNGAWLRKSVLVMVMMEASGCKRKTATNLLGAAVDAGVLERRAANRGGKKTYDYRTRARSSH